METPLAKVLRLASPDLMEPSALGGPGKDMHEHLMRDCPFYAQVSHGRKADPGCCKAANGKKQSPPGVVYKLTSHTPEASTVHKPTVPPGGPGLFHHKGLQLPAYVQHLWFHLAAKYGKHRAYGMAVGIVKKWAKGVNPGGKHPTKTHPDVRAAAQRNVAEWERDKKMGGKKLWELSWTACCGWLTCRGLTRSRTRSCIPCRLPRSTPAPS